MVQFPIDEGREAEVDRSSSLEDSHPMLAPRRGPAAVDLVRVAQEAKVLGALFRKPQLPRFGRYIVLDQLGHGGMGVVLKGYDEELNRQVALKVLHSNPTKRQGQRLKREAQALAKLAHPNVVQVFEVGEAEDQVFVAMELVEGQTLRQWHNDRDPPRGWKECVEVYLQAGRGLAAAHAEGLVHRDFKPSNAIVDHQQRVRVVDFGLVRGVEGGRLDESREDGPEVTLKPKDDALGSPLTRAGQVMGTLPYMPLEQLDGQLADARSDQFSFCVSLFEAVYGQRPFMGDTMAVLMASVAAGQIRPAPRRTKVPAKLRQVLLRGLTAEPEQRWPSMDTLLAELSTLIVPRSRRWLAVGLTGGLAALGGTLALGQYAEVRDRCTGAQTELDGVWDVARSQQVQGAVLGTDLPYAADTWERIEPRLDGYAQAWTRKHTEVCEATIKRGEQTDEAMDLRMSCLRERKVALRAAVTVLADADDTVVEKAVRLVEALPSIDPCDDLHRLQQLRQRIPPPEDPQVEQQVEAVRARLAVITAERKAGRPADALEHVEPVVLRAEALEYGPALAEALLERGSARHDNDELAEAERDLERAFILAAEHGHDAVAASAVAWLAFVVGYRQERHERGLGLGKTALALALGPEVEATARATALGSIGSVLDMQGKHLEALAHHRDTLAIYEQAFGPEHTSVAMALNNIGIALRRRGMHSEALSHHRDALAIYEQTLSSGHPSVALTLTNIGIALKNQGKLPEALARYRRALTIYERALGKNNAEVADTMNNIGNVLKQQGKLSEALNYHRDALAIWEQTFGKEHSTVATSLNNIGAVLQAQDELPEAEDHFRRALAIWERALGKKHSLVGNALTNLGSALQRQGKLSEALNYHQDALATWEQALGTDHPKLAYPLVGLTQIALDQRNFHSARAHAERAVSIREAGEVASDLLAETRFVLARALWSDRAERARAHALARQARDTFAEHGHGREHDLAGVDSWLTEHRP